MKKLILILGLIVTLGFGSTMEEAKYAYTKKDYKKVFKIYENLASYGNPKAQFNLGFMYRDGIFVKRDYSKAMEWFSKSAEQEIAEAENEIGVLYFDGKGFKTNKQLGLKWFKKSASKGYCIAEYNLAVQYEKGKYLTKNLSLASELYYSSCKGTNKYSLCENGYKSACRDYKNLKEKGYISDKEK